MSTLAAVVTAFLCVPAAVASDQPDPATLNDLVTIYGVGDMPADLLVVVDTSSSMSVTGDPPPWGDVRGAWDALVDSVGPSDRLGLVLFARDSGLVWDLGAAISSPEDKAAAKAALPPTAEGDATDIGKGLNAAVQALSGGGASDIQRVVVITDGAHNPDEGSPFPLDPNAGDWPTLKAEGAALEKSRQGRLDAFGWVPQGSGVTDIGLVPQVFPEAQIWGIPNDQFKVRMASLAADAQRERVLEPVTTDLATPITSTFVIEPPLDADVAGFLTLTNPRQGLPTIVDLKSVTVTEQSGAPVPVTVTPQVLTLAPGQSTSVPVQLQPSETDHGRLALGERLDARTWTVAVDAPTSLSPALTDLLRVERLAEPDKTVGQVAQPESVSISAPFGLAWWKFILAVVLIVAALVALALFLRWVFVPPQLAGRIEDGDGKLLLGLSGREMALPQGPVQAPGSDDQVRLFTKPRNHAVWIERVKGQPSKGEQPLLGRAKKLIGGDAIKLGTLTVTFRREGGTKK